MKGSGGAGGARNLERAFALGPQCRKTGLGCKFTKSERLRRRGEGRESEPRAQIRTGAPVWKPALGFKLLHWLLSLNRIAILHVRSHRTLENSMVRGSVINKLNMHTLLEGRRRLSKHQRFSDSSDVVVICGPVAPARFLLCHDYPQP